MYDGDLAAFHDAHHGTLAQQAAVTMIDLLTVSGWRHGMVADVGCGGGLTAEALLSAGYDVHASDPSAAMMAMLQERAPAAVKHRADVARLLLPRGLVGITAIGEVLNHDLVGDLDETLERFHAALRPGGVVLFDVAGPRRHGEDGEETVVEEVRDAVAITRARRQRMRTTRRITLFTHAGGGMYRRHGETHELRLYPAADVRAGLARAGFVAVRQLERYGAAEQTFVPGWAAFAAAKP